ncbi:4-hydroxy-tetrahydrodipicolinate synthase [Pseudomonas chengduensis]|uniref:4-hydroxy-tetrahydrodipicolinate synthase n=1 Tax=Ectopseudomonas oleovorans TaxID=301 RepID=A0AA42TY81_ECTOL|nr:MULTISPECIES: 4-hydroxy-tetrahydrodipicolinate synthase [Pseudomonas]MDH1338148.1 4-hydroxy-tetrahydrodipicolinate synthase [Pseudomonas oleovorans]MDH1493954.1 4-hydroxy-tetrahydrodipicolinate synthase [Pseudomonas oleovorans]MDH1681718.1 4-hydroxy-tetrahydrodipicolinate synthase [Pseudomonas chengduensis]WGG20077.1 4-hydroxy-tetrahydrodipicolinate synthase [Pseudomonas oleovorans]
MSAFQGIWVALVTPFRHGEVDFASLDRLTEQLLSDGVAGLVVCGTTGEAAALSQSEQLAVLDAVLRRAPAQQVIMGLAGNQLNALLDLQREIQRRPIAGLLVPAPYYIRPSQAGLEHFFTTLANAATVPLVLYDIPYRTGVRIERETLLRIVRHPNIQAIKDCAGDVETTMALIAGGQVQVLAGEDTQIFTTLCLGGAGAISASAHIRADLYVRMQQCVKQGDLAAGRQLHYRLLPWMQAAFAEANPTAIKAALALQGLLDEELRSPLMPCTTATRTRLQEVLGGLAR